MGIRVYGSWRSLASFRERPPRISHQRPSVAPGAATAIPDARRETAEARNADRMMAAIPRLGAVDARYRAYLRSRVGFGLHHDGLLQHLKDGRGVLIAQSHGHRFRIDRLSQGK
jgi:hypothetical protein